MKFVNEQGKSKWEKFVEVNSKDSYSYTTVKYAQKWANLMEAKIDNGEKLEVIADKTSHAADTMGITGFMYGCAVNVLSQVWIYGERLRKWHNAKYGVKGDGVVNPAVLTIEVD